VSSFTTCITICLRYLHRVLKMIHNWEVVSVVHLKNYLFLFLFYIHISSACHLLPGICGCASFWFIMHSIKYGCHEEAQLLLDWHTSNEI
jgi:hypothetical protein